LLSVSSNFNNVLIHNDYTHFTNITDDFGTTQNIMDIKINANADLVGVSSNILDININNVESFLQGEIDTKVDESTYNTFLEAYDNFKDALDTWQDAQTAWNEVQEGENALHTARLCLSSPRGRMAAHPRGEAHPAFPASTSKNPIPAYWARYIY